MYFFLKAVVIELDPIYILVDGQEIFQLCMFFTHFYKSSFFHYYKYLKFMRLFLLIIESKAACIFQLNW